jgi:hypothetical protein
MKFIFLTSVFLISVAIAPISAWAQPPVLRDVSYDFEPQITIADVRGTIKRSAVVLPKPTYPSQAREAAVDGTVKVEIVIDASGSVVSARAVSGDPLLFASCETAALRTKFRRIDGVSPDFSEKGSLFYGFSLGKMGWLRAGFELGQTQSLFSSDGVNFRHLKRMMKADWIGERETTEKLTGLTAGLRASRPGPPVLVSEQSSKTSNSSTSAKTWQITPMPDENLNIRAEASALATGLSAALRARLGGEPLDLWEFETGLELIRVMLESRDPATRKAASAKLRTMAETAPGGADQKQIQALRSLADVFSSSRNDKNSSEQMRTSLRILLNSPRN